MEFRVLGRLEIYDGDRVITLGSHKQRALLALLLINRGGVVSADSAIDQLWGDVAIDRQNALWVHISNLRSALEPDRAARSEGTIILTKPPGYVLDVDSEQIDAARFERLVVEGRASLAHDPEAASTTLRSALGLWRGRAYEEFTYDMFAQGEIARLDEIRLEAVEARIDVDLALGRSRELVSELESLTRQHPLRERFTAQLMLALYRASRQAEALRAYQALRSRLGEELGIEPSPELKQLEGQILEEDPTLFTAPVARQHDVVELGPAVRGYEIRERLSSGPNGVVHRAFQPAVGREVAITVIPTRVADDPSFIRRFEGEARLIAALEHPHIAPVYDFWREPGAAYLVTRLMRGGSLADVVRTSALSPEDAARIVGQIAGALESAHAGGVVHGDVRPSNIVLDEEGNAYLSGFGLGAVIGSETGYEPTKAPEIDAGLPTSPASDVYALGAVLAQAMSGFTGRVEQIEGALPTEVTKAIAHATDPDPANRPTVSEFANDFVNAVRPDEPSDVYVPRPVENPYRGLAAFGANDAALFFGRQRVIDRIVARLGGKGPRSRFVAIVGPSGSGKSSVVNAGLRPALTRNAIPSSSEWFVTSMTPGTHPFEALESALLRVAVDPPPGLFDQLHDGESGLRRAARRVLPEDGSQLLIIIDQFEELFTRADPAVADRFLDSLVGAIADDHSRVRIVLTLRADFYDRPLQHRSFGELLREGTEVITPMSTEELEQAIECPVEPLNVRFAPVVLAELVREVQGRPGALPLLQYTLTELFEQRSSPTITIDTYREIGGVTGAIAMRAESLYHESDKYERQAARQIFLRLVTLGEGTVDTRRRVLASELEALPLHPGAVNAVLDRFSSHRLLTFDRDPVTRGPTVEISHEALLTEWRRLQSWIDSARDDVRSQRRLAAASVDWEASGRREDLLLTGGALARLSAWSRDTDIRLSSGEQEFLAASVEAGERAAIEEAEREARRAAAEGKARRRLRQTAAMAAVALVIGFLAIVALLQGQAARRSEDQLAANARARDLATASTLALQDDVTLAIRLAIEAVAATADFGVVAPEALDSLHWAVQRAGLTYPADSSTPVAIRPGPRGPTGVYALPPNELIELAQSGTVGSFDAQQCTTYLQLAQCPDSRRALPGGLEIAGGDRAYGVVPQGPTALSGTTLDLVTVFAPDPAFERELASFEELTGIVVSHPDADPETEVARRIEDEEPLPDLIVWPQPANVAAQGPDLLIDLSAYLDMKQVRDDFGDYLVSLGTVGDGGLWPSSQGGFYGLPVDIDLKGLVFYSPARFAAAGYDVPGSWEELMALSQRMLQDDRTPWCFHFAGGLFSGWPGTDLLETLVLRVGGPDLYNAWTWHEIAFDHPEIRRAAELAEQLLFTEGFVSGGSQSISRIDPFVRGLDSLLGDQPDCWMIHQGDFMLNFVPPQDAIGHDIGWFPFPPIEPGGFTGQYGGGNYLGVMQDRPEVRVFVQYAAAPEWGREWSATQSGFISPNARFDTAAYGRGLDSPAAAGVLRQLGELARSAVASGTWRFDASDLMPPEIGSIRENDEPAFFYQAMVDVVDGVRTMDQVLADIEAAWQALERED